MTVSYGARFEHFSSGIPLETAPAGRYTAVSPNRLMDSRAGVGTPARLVGGQVVAHRNRFPGHLLQYLGEFGGVQVGGSCTRPFSAARNCACAVVLTRRQRTIPMRNGRGINTGLRRCRIRHSILVVVTSLLSRIRCRRRASRNLRKSQIGTCLRREKNSRSK